MIFPHPWHRLIRLAVLAVASLLAFAVPAAADWLVTRDGTRIETEGSWEVKGRQVIFTRKHGALSALRLSDVDLEASASATAAALAPAAGAGEAGDEVERPPVLVLTNDDIRRAASPPAAGEGASAGDTAESAAPAPAFPESEAPVELVSWKANLSRQVDGLELVGAVKNNGDNFAAKVTVQVTIPDGAGGSLYETNAFLRASGLPPGGTTTFRALLPGLFQLVEDPVFRVTAGGITIGVGAPPAAEAPEDEGQGGES